MAGSVRAEELNSGNHVKGQLLLLDSKKVASDRAHLTYRKISRDQGALITVSTYHRENALRLIGRDTDLILKIGSSLFSVDGEIKSIDLPVFSIAPSHL